MREFLQIQIIVLGLASFSCQAQNKLTQVPTTKDAKNVVTPVAGSKTSVAPSADVTNQKAKFTPELIARGEKIYKTYCIACHNMNPALKGSQGPEIASSSLELLRARVIKGEYPAGYTPKRNTKNMRPLPFLEKELSALEAFLNK